MTPSRIALAAFALAALAVAAPAAAQTTANINISANVLRNCTISAGAINFGAYDPVTANDVAPADQNGAVTIRCTRGTAWSVALGDGANFSGGRRMQLGATGEYLGYELYRGSVGGTVWNAASPETGTAASRAAVNLTVYGRIPGGQDVVEGAYTDTVVATISF